MSEISAMVPGVAFQNRVADRRLARPVFVFPERRCGFDRRCATGLLYTLSRDSRLLLGTIVLLNLLSLTDWFLTTRLMHAGAVEANLALALLGGSGPLAFGAVKFIVMCAVSAAIWSWRQFRLVIAVAVGAAGVYMLVVVCEFALGFSR